MLRSCQVMHDKLYLRISGWIYNEPLDYLRLALVLLSL